MTWRELCATTCAYFPRRTYSNPGFAQVQPQTQTNQPINPPYTQSEYFAVGKIERDQVQDYAHRKGMVADEVERWLSANLAYEHD